MLGYTDNTVILTFRYMYFYITDKRLFVKRLLWHNRKFSAAA